MCPTPEAFNDLIYGDLGVNLFSPWFLFDYPIKGQRTIADLFLREQGAWLSASGRDYIEALACTAYIPYEVQEVRRDEGMLLKNLWDDSKIWISEKLATHQLHPWDILATRIRQGPGPGAYLDPGAFIFPLRAKRALLETLRDFHKTQGENADLAFFKHTAPLICDLWQEYAAFPPPPEIRNTDGDQLCFTTQRFEVLNERALAYALDQREYMERGEKEGAYRWIRKQDDDGLLFLGSLAVEQGILTAETNSRKRANALRKLLQTTAGGALRFLDRHEKSLQAALKDKSIGPQSADETQGIAPQPLPPEEQTAFVHAHLERHMHKWLDMALPALRGLTPRKAALLPSMRGPLADLLKQLENDQLRREETEGVKPYDMSWLWKELGLDRD